MATSSSPTMVYRLACCLERMRDHDQAAHEQLISHADGMLRNMTRAMVRDFPGVRRWEETDDVWQMAALRFHQSIREFTPQNLSHFFGMAARQIRRTLIELARKHQGPMGLAANHETNHGRGHATTHGGYEANLPDETHDPVALAEWAEFHQQIEGLPDPQREVFDLVWYAGLPQEEAAEVLGISVRTLKRRWREARLTLYEIRSGAPPAT